MHARIRTNAKYRLDRSAFEPVPGFLQLPESSVLASSCLEPKPASFSGLHKPYRLIYTLTLQHISLVYILLII